MTSPADPVTSAPDTELVVAELVQRHVLEARDTASPERLAEIEAQLARTLRASRADATLNAYRSDWEDFVTWCSSVGFAALPAAPATVAAYLAEMAAPPDDRKPLAVSTIQRRKAAIGEAHKLAGHPNPCLDPLVKTATKGIRRRRGVAPENRKTGVTTADIRALVGGLDGSLIHVRDRALLLVGAGAWKRRRRDLHDCN